MKHIIFLTSFILLFSCSEKQLEPIDAVSGKPMPVTDVSAVATSGGAIISFTIPKDKNVLQVKAVYTITNGAKREATTSYYGNSLKLEGYNDLNEHEALLYTVSRAQELSEPVAVRFTPLESPISKAIATASITSDFGGAYFFWRNEDNAMLTVEMLAEDAQGELKTARIVSSALDSAHFSIRGYEPRPQKFGVIFRDNFDNVSDVIYPEGGSVTPWLESVLDRKLVSVFKINNNYLTGDATFVNWEGRDEYMFDGDVTTYGHSYTGSLPVAITLDLGKQSRLSRIVFFQRLYSNLYYLWGNPRRIIIYGRHDPPATGNWNEWTQLLDFNMVKPSGTNSDFTINTDEDVQAAVNGHEATLPITTDTYRYVRFHFMTSWENRPYVHPAEIVFYGEYAE